MRLKTESGRMVCPDYGAETEPDDKDRRECVYAFEYIITEEREMRRTRTAWSYQKSGLGIGKKRILILRRGS